MLSNFERQLCDIQGRLFERSLDQELDSTDFTQKFMQSQTCKSLDLPYDRLQWAGEEYILENLLEEISVQEAASRQFSREALSWIGYVYRYWHFEDNDSSANIYAVADAAFMNECYLGFHTLDVSMAIQDLKEISKQRK